MTSSSLGQHRQFWADAFRKIGRLTLVFVLGQGALQTLNIITVLCLLRWMSIEAYAQYSVSLAFQTSATALISLGITDSIVPLVGARGSDRALVGRYVLAAQHLRSRIFLAVAPLCSAAFLVVAHIHHWDITSQVLLLACVLFALLWSATVSAYAAPLVVHHKLLSYYSAQNLAAVARLGLYLILLISGSIGAVSAAFGNALSLWISGALTKAKAAPLVELPAKPDAKVTHEVLHCMLPMMPSAVVSAFQPQLALFLVSIFGQVTEIAQISALNRISQIFFLFAIFSKLVVEPIVARTPSSRLPMTCSSVLLLAGAVGALVSILAFIYPRPIVWILGSKYADLSPVVAWVVLNGCLTTIANLIWIMNRARRWLFWRGSILEVALLIGFQTAYVVAVGVATINRAAIFLLTATAANLIAHSYIMYYGFSRERQVRQDPAAPVLK